MADGRTAAVVVNHNAGEVLVGCVRSLLDEGVSKLVVVDNASDDGSADLVSGSDPRVEIVRSATNLGYGAGANLGIARLKTDFVVVSNPDVDVHCGALERMSAVLDADPVLAIVGPRIQERDGRRYPSARRFPSMFDAAGHVLLGQFSSRNPFTRRYRMEDVDPSSLTLVDWVSGAFFVARRQALAELAGFDESYFMYAEDVDLCWRARRAGWEVAYAPDAVVTHLRGVSAARRPYRMLMAHHRSALRFAARSSRGWRSATLPFVALALAVRFVLAVARQVFTRRSGRRTAHPTW